MAVIAAAGIGACLAVMLAVAGTDEAPNEVQLPTPETAVTLPEAEATEIVELTPLEEAVQYEPPYSEYEVELLAQTVYGEALITHSDTEMAAVVWCILNRVDSDTYQNTIEEVVTSPNQFCGYSAENPVDEHIKWLVMDVLARWISEDGEDGNSGRVLPKEYLFFTGDGQHNYFTSVWHGGESWDWSLDSPYDN